MKIIFSLAVIFTPLYVWSSSSSQAVLTQSFMASTKLVLPDAQGQANALLLRQSISEKERDGCISLLMAERPSAAVNELSVALKRLRRESASIEAEQSKHKEVSQAEQCLRKNQRDACRQMHNDYQRMHQEGTSEIESISMEFHSPNGKVEPFHDGTLTILLMIQTLNGMLINDPSTLIALLKKGEKTKELQGHLRTLDLGVMFDPSKPSEAAQSKSNDQEEASDNDAVQKSKQAERKKAEYLRAKQIRLLEVLTKSSVLLQSLDEEEGYYSQKIKAEADSFAEKLATIAKQIEETMAQLEEKRKELAKYNELIELMRKKKVQ